MAATLRWCHASTAGRRETRLLPDALLPSQGGSSGLGICTGESGNPWSSSSSTQASLIPLRPNASYAITTAWPWCWWSMRCFTTKAGWIRLDFLLQPQSRYWKKCLLWSVFFSFFFFRFTILPWSQSMCLLFSRSKWLNWACMPLCWSSVQKGRSYTWTLTLRSWPRSARRTAWAGWGWRSHRSPQSYSGERTSWKGITTICRWGQRYSLCSTVRGLVFGWRKNSRLTYESRMIDSCTGVVNSQILTGNMEAPPPSCHFTVAISRLISVFPLELSRDLVYFEILLLASVKNI